jgi:hypothetical protein
MIKETMQNPKSFEHIKTDIDYSQFSYTVTVSFMGQNVYRALVQNSESVRFDRNHRVQ